MTALSVYTGCATDHSRRKLTYADLLALPDDGKRHDMSWSTASTMWAPPRRCATRAPPLRWPPGAPPAVNLF